MSKADNLKDFLVDLANAIREKKNKTGAINPQDFSAEILSIIAGDVQMPNVSGTLVITEGITEEDFEALKAILGDNITIDAQGGVYIKFADPEVLRVLLANGVGDGMGITADVAKKVTSISNWFKNNTVIETFDEFEKFIGITSLSNTTLSPSASPFYQCTNLTSIKIPSSVNVLGFYAFNKCTSLRNISISQNITKILEGCFQDVPWEGELNFPQLVELSKAFMGSGIKKIVSLGSVETAIGLSSNINYASFSHCTNLEEVHHKFKQYGTGAFNGCTSLNYVDLSDAVKIESHAFNNCTSLSFEDLQLPNLTSLGQNAFYGVKIKKLVLGSDGVALTLSTGTNSTQNYGDRSVLEEVVLPDTVTDIPTQSFYGYTALSKYNLSHVKTISSGAFGNTPYKDVVDLSSIVSLNNSAINKTNWGKIIIGENCTTISQYNFWQLKSAPILIVRAVTPPSLAGNNNMSFCSVIYVPDASVEAYKAATNWSNYSDRIKPLSEYEG